MPALSSGHVPGAATGSEDGGRSTPGSKRAARRDFLDRAFDRVGPGVMRNPTRLFWWGIWLVFLVNPIASLAGGRFHGLETWLAGASLLAFALLYLLAGWVAFGTTWDATSSPDLRPYALLLGITVPTMFWLGGAWSEMFIYLGVATGATLELSSAVGLLALLVGGDFVGAALNRWPLADVWFAAFMTVALGLTMISFRRVIRLIGELRAAREDLARLAVAEERLRFARDLHDVLGHSLSVIALKGQVARRLMTRDPEAAQAALMDVESVAHESLASLREMVAGYRQRSLAVELANAEEVLAAASIRPIMPATAPTLPAPADELLAWVVREGVTNVLRHSRASSCRISIARDDRQVRIEIVDDGPGAGPSPEGNGLQGLSERLAGAGGTFAAGPAPDGGFRLAATVPVGPVS